jgi:nucleobase transporter 1/2
LLGAAQAILLGFQHYFVVLGTSVLITTLLVPAMGGGNVSRIRALLLLHLPKGETLISPPLMLTTQDEKVRVFQTLLFAAGVNTLFQSLFGTRLPAVIGGSYAFIVPVLSIIYSDRLQSIQDERIVGQISGLFSRFLLHLFSSLLLLLSHLGHSGHFHHASRAPFHRPFIESMPIFAQHSIVPQNSIQHHALAILIRSLFNV